VLPQVWLKVAMNAGAALGAATMFLVASRRSEYVLSVFRRKLLRPFLLTGADFVKK